MVEFLMGVNGALQYFRILLDVELEHGIALAVADDRLQAANALLVLEMEQ